MKVKIITPTGCARNGRPYPLPLRSRADGAAWTGRIRGPKKRAIIAIAL
jgi:hypothetical protein